MNSLISTSTYLLASALLSSCSPVIASDDLSLLWQAARQGRYVQASDRELQRAEELFVSELNQTDTEHLKKSWRALGWERKELGLNGRQCVVLHESEDQYTGRGFYLICPQAPRNVALQIPHSFSDRRTGEIGLQLANTAEFRLTAWNTTPRYEKREKARISTDLAHLPESYFTALTRAISRVSEIKQLVQLHGFSRAKRKTSASSANIILSGGTRSPNESLKELAEKLRLQVDAETRLFPDEVQELGALTNRQGALLRAAGNCDFVHIEMSAELRQQLIQSSLKRQTLLLALPR